MRLKELAARQATAITRNFQERIKLNFESDLAKARLTYQEYLLRLTEACALGSVMISSSQPERLEELGHVLHFSVQAIGTTEQIGRLIDGFYQTEALHRISHLNIFQSLGPDSPTHSLTLDVAVLVLESDTDSKGNLASPAGHLLKDLFASQDIFRRRASGVITQPELNLESGCEHVEWLFQQFVCAPSLTLRLLTSPARNAFFGIRAASATSHRSQIQRSPGWHYLQGFKEICHVL